jgi:hypothetical protein
MRTPGYVTIFVPCLAALVLAGAGTPLVQSPSGPVEGLHRALDDLLDIQVRDGYVYYAALKSHRGTLDRYVASLDGPAAAPARYETWSPQQQAAFWLNAYNAFVLREVIDNYPIRARGTNYPPNSVRQIPGVFDRKQYRAAGRSVTLDAIENEILPAFRDPRLYLALGRGAVGSGRLRSEAYTGARLEEQLSLVVAEFPRRSELFRLDKDAHSVSVTQIVGWHQDQFIEAYAGDLPGFAARSPIERAIMAFVQPHLLPSEREVLRQDAFTVTYHDFDWRLNDLTGGRPR